MNIAVDYGNTTVKVGIFEQDELKQKHIFTQTLALHEFLEENPSDHIIVSSVSQPAEFVLMRANASGKKVALTSTLPVPLKIAYQTPITLGVDRIAAVCGALELFPETPRLVIDAGTCITYEFLDANNVYQGGSITPGVNMRFEAMHKFTSRLPLIGLDANVPLIGVSTETCMQSGVVHGIRAEVDGIISRYTSLYPGLNTIVCGGAAPVFENHLVAKIHKVPDLVLLGLNRILRFHIDG